MIKKAGDIPMEWQKTDYDRAKTTENKVHSEVNIMRTKYHCVNLPELGLSFKTQNTETKKLSEIFQPLGAG
ncbi:MAG: hypothetical protein IPP31_04770 [Chitinophagaceae bacterium]|nr:hypothetical protein [Chitinophagaceae bacterium]